MDNLHARAFTDFTNWGIHKLLNQLVERIFSKRGAWRMSWGWFPHTHASRPRLGYNADLCISTTEVAKGKARMFNCTLCYKLCFLTSEIIPEIGKEMVLLEGEFCVFLWVSICLWFFCFCFCLVVVCFFVFFLSLISVFLSSRCFSDTEKTRGDEGNGFLLSYGRHFLHPSFL